MTWQTLKKETAKQIKKKVLFFNLKKQQQQQKGAVFQLKTIENGKKRSTRYKDGAIVMLYTLPKGAQFE